MRLTIIALAVLAALGISMARAQEWPSRPVTLVQGFGAGGNTDSIARVLAEALSRALGASFIVEAKPGAGGRLASEAVAKAAPDGHTLVLLTGAHASSAAMHRKLRYDPLDSFAFVSLVGRFPFVIATRPDGPVRSLEDLVRVIREEPGKLTYSSAGFGSVQHLTGELLSLSAGGKLTHVPYRGGTQPLTDLMGGQIDLIFDTLTATIPGIEAGTLRGLAVTSRAPWPAIPTVPPVASRLPSFEVISWVGLAAPAKTPKAVIDKLRAALDAAARDPDVQRRLTALGVETGFSTPEEMRVFIEDQVKRWNAVIDQAGLQRHD